MHIYFITTTKIWQIFIVVVVCYGKTSRGVYRARERNNAVSLEL